MCQIPITNIMLNYALICLKKPKYNAYEAGLTVPRMAIRTKYHGAARGGFTATSFKNYRLPPSIVNAIVGAANCSLAKNPWSSYNTAERHMV